MKTEKNVVGEVKLSYVTKAKINEQPKIINSAAAYEIFKNIWEPESINYRESMYLLCLNRHNRVIAWYRISTGGLNGTVADPKLVFQCCLLTHASYFILAHNHPSEVLTPSKEDIAITKQFKEAGKVLDIEMRDHLIISEDNYFSFADNGQF